MRLQKNKYTINLPAIETKGVEKIGDELYLCKMNARQKLVFDKLSLYFCRELECCQPGTVLLPGRHFFLFCEPVYAMPKYLLQVFGGCVVCLSDENSDSPTLSWIWMHPYQRNQGKGSAIIKSLNDYYSSNFKISTPYSAAMQNIINKNKGEICTQKT